MRGLGVLFLLLLSGALFAQFSNVDVSINGSSAYIRWDTEYNCSGKVLYGKNQSLTSSATNYTKSTSHLVVLRSLAHSVTYYYRLQCAYNSTVHESEVMSFTIPPAYPDLVLSNVTLTPATQYLGKNITVKAYVRNTGDERAANVSLVVQCGDGTRQSRTIQYMGAGTTQAVSFQCTPPTAAGTVQIAVSIDPSNEIIEKDEGNNQMTATATYLPAPKPDLAVSQQDIAYQLKEAGGKQNISLTVGVRNIGSEKASNVPVCANARCSKISAIPANSTARVTLLLPPSERSVSILVDPNNTVDELNEQNNKVVIRISEDTFLPDIHIDDLLVSHTPALLRTGSTATIRAKVYNYGQAAARNVTVVFKRAEKIEVCEQNDEEAVRSEIEMYQLGRGAFSSFVKREAGRGSRTVNIRGEVVGTATIDFLAPGASKTVSAYVVMPPNTKHFDVAVILDPDNNIHESNEENNLAVHPLDIETLYPDLAINGTSGISVSPVPELGKTSKVTARVENRGTFSARNVSVDFYASTDGEKYSLFRHATVDVLNAKSSRSVYADWVAPAGAKEVSFLVKVDGEDAVFELAEDNNDANRTVNISLPDLSVQGINYSGAVSVGSEITLRAELKNVGTSKATNVQVVFYYVKPSGETVEIGSKTISSLSAGASSVQSIQWKIPSGIPAHPVVQVRANPLRTIYERDFSNNDASLSLDAKLPDLSVSLSSDKSAAIVPSAAGYNSYVKVSASVRNSGNAPATAIPVQVFANGVKIKEEMIQKLEPGASAEVTDYFRINNTYSGREVVFSAVVNPSGTITETITDNNNAELRLPTVQNSPPNAVISADRATALRGQLFTFDCRNSSDSDSSYYYCKWRFDNTGVWEDGWEVSKSFPTAGQHLVTLMVTDNHGGSDTEQLYVTVLGNQPPIAVLDNAQYLAYKGEPISFSPLSSIDHDGGIASVYWEFGDGSTATESFDVVTHTYSNVGVYTLRMRVTDTDGATSTATAQVTVVPPPQLVTKTGTEYYISHTYHSPWAAGPQAAVYYGIYRIDYKVKYTPSDNVIRYLEYNISAGPAIVTQVTDNDAESLYIDMTAVATHGRTSLNVNKVEIRNGNTVAWSATGGPQVSASQVSRKMSYSGLEVPMSGPHTYVVVDMDISYPGQMCAAEQYDCQWQVAFWQVR